MYLANLIATENWRDLIKDRPRITNGRLKFDPIKGARLSLFSNSLNFVLVLVLFVSFFLGSKSGAGIGAFGSLYAVVWYIQRTISAMFMGINSYFSPVNTVEGIRYIIPDSIYHPVFYLLTIVPSVISVALGYYMGANDRKLLTVNASK